MVGKNKYIDEQKQDFYVVALGPTVQQPRRRMAIPNLGAKRRVSNIYNKNNIIDDELSTISKGPHDSHTA